MRRRRFLTIMAAGLCPVPGKAQDWQGRAFGADVSLRIAGAAPMDAVLAEIAVIEATFSLFGPSELVRLNRDGAVRPSDRMREVLDLCGRVHAATDGCFDPTVQPLWRALADGGDTIAARSAIGFARIDIGQEVRLHPGQALTLNGIVQGYAADRVAAILAAHGLTECLIDMGEFAALGGPYRLAVEDPAAGRIGTRTLASHRAMATSSPGAQWLPGGSHILGPRAEAPRWSTVSVEGPSAALADAASTAFVLMEDADIRRARDRLGLGAVLLVDAAGDARLI